MQVVALTQPINSLAFVFDGLHFGASDFAYAAYSMVSAFSVREWQVKRSGPFCVSVLKSEEATDQPVIFSVPIACRY